MSDRFEIQVTVTDVQIGKMIFDRKSFVYDMGRVSGRLHDLAEAFDVTPQSDQSRQEIQYNETRTVSPTITRDADFDDYPIVADVPTINERNAEREGTENL